VSLFAREVLLVMGPMESIRSTYPMFAIYTPFMYYSWCCAGLLSFATIATMLNFSDNADIDDFYNWSMQ
jgi:hypothetical protein